MADYHSVLHPRVKPYCEHLFCQIIPECGHHGLSSAMRIDETLAGVFADIEQYRRREQREGTADYERHFPAVVPVTTNINTQVSCHIQIFRHVVTDKTSEISLHCQ